MAKKTSSRRKKTTSKKTSSVPARRTETAATKPAAKKRAGKRRRNPNAPGAVARRPNQTPSSSSGGKKKASTLELAGYSVLGAGVGGLIGGGVLWALAKQEAAAEGPVSMSETAARIRLLVKSHLPTLLATVGSGLAVYTAQGDSENLTTPVAASIGSALGGLAFHGARGSLLGAPAGVAISRMK